MQKEKDKQTWQKSIIVKISHGHIVIHSTSECFCKFENYPKKSNTKATRSWTFVERAPQVNILRGCRMSLRPPCTHPPGAVRTPFSWEAGAAVPVSLQLATGSEQVCQALMPFLPKAACPLGWEKGIMLSAGPCAERKGKVLCDN